MNEGLKRSAKTQIGDTEVVSFTYDRILLLVIFALMGIGIVMVYSASIVTAQADRSNEAFYLHRQLIYIGAALTLLVATMNIHHCVWRFAHVLFAFSFCWGLLC